MKTIIGRGSPYDDIRIVHISETGIIVLQLNVQIGLPIVGQMMKIFISCNQRKTCEFQREGERERERGWVGVGVCLCPNEVRTMTRDLVFYNFTINLILYYLILVF